MILQDSKKPRLVIVIRTSIYNQILEYLLILKSEFILYTMDLEIY